MTPAGLTCLHVVVALLRVQPSANSGEGSSVDLLLQVWADVAAAPRCSSGNTDTKVFGGG